MHICAFFGGLTKKFVGPFENQHSLIFSSAACRYVSNKFSDL